MVRRILLLTTDLEIGGTPTVVRELAIRLRPQALVEVACLGQWGPVADQLLDAQIGVTAFGARRPTDLHVVRDAIRLIRRRWFDTVFSFLIHANTTAAIASWFCPGVRFIQSIQTTQPRPKWHWWLQRIAQHFAEKIVVPSPSAARAASRWADVPEEKLVVIPNAVDADLAAPGASDARDPSTRKELRIGFLGRLDPVKRVEDLVRAVALLDDRFVLHVWGEGEDRARIEAEVGSLGLRDRVTLHGATVQPQAAMRHIDVLALPSEAEGFGLVLIEAMAVGVPVVATDAPGIRDVVRDGVSGLLVPVGQPAALADALRRVATDVALRGQLVARARDEVVSGFTWDRVLPMYRRLLGIDQS